MRRRPRNTNTYQYSAKNSVTRCGHIILTFGVKYTLSYSQLSSLTLDIGSHKPDRQNRIKRTILEGERERESARNTGMVFIVIIFKLSFKKNEF